MAQSALEKKFTFLWVHAIKGPTDITLEHKFHPSRKWRFDFAHKPTKVAIEIEGGVTTHKSRHTKPQGFKEDCLKYNAASMLGWVVFRLTADMLTSDQLEAIAKYIRFKASNPQP